MAWLILLLFALFLAGIPITFALGLTSLVGLLLKGIPLLVLVQKLWTGVDSFSLVAVPLFIMAGSLMSYGGISRRLVEFAQMLVGHWTAGLAMVSIVGCMFFAAVSGSAIADAAAIGGLLIPAMVAQGYDRRFAATLVASAGTIGPIIPPSIPMVLYGVMAGASIAKLFAAGFIPGVLMGVGLALYAYSVGKQRGYRGRETRATLREVRVGLKDAVLPLATPLIIIGGILSGAFTATESGVIAVVYALILGIFVYRELKWSDLPQIIRETGLTTATVLFVIGTASLFTWLLTVNQVPQQLTRLIVSLNAGKVLVLLMVNIVLLVVGTFIDTISALTIFTPLFLPLVTAIGVDPVHFGVILAVNLTIGMITPPLGVVLFVTSGIAKVSIREMLPDLAPQVAVLLGVLAVITYWADLVMWLPNLLP